MRKSRTTTGGVGFRNRIWGEKPRLDSRVVNVIRARVDSGEVQSNVLDEIARLYQIMQ
jgi:hypothetical protein